MRDLQLETASMALLSYPVLQSADILMVKGDVVPVGKDQASHVELTREIARRFNQTFAAGVPGAGRADLRSHPHRHRRPGEDGQVPRQRHLPLRRCRKLSSRKCSRCTPTRTASAPTSPAASREIPVFIYHDAFNDDKDEVEDLKTRYRKGTVGDVEVKKKLAAAINRFLDPIRERRASFAARKGLGRGDHSARGLRAAREECQQTLAEAREAMGLTYFRGEKALELGT